MGALSGSLSASKFYVQGDLPKDVRRAYLERIQLRLFRPLRPEQEAEESAGWCAVGQPFDLELSSEKVFSGPYLSLGFRTDRYRFPPAVVHAELEQAARGLRQKRAQEKLSRTQKEELKQRVLTALRRKYLPRMQAVDLVWNLDRQELYFWSQSAGLRDRLCALFELSFGLELVLDSPYVAAARTLDDKALEAALQQVALSAFHEDVHGSR
jgi:DNA recombination-dependent growth factor C